MRRTKSHKLHPSSQAIAAALSQYQDGDDEPILYRPGDPQDSLWHDLPILPITESWCIVKKYDFHSPEDVDLTTLWDQYKDDLGATEPSIAAEQGGGMTFASADEHFLSYNFVYDQYGIFEFIQGKTAWFEMTVRNDIVGEGRVGRLHFGFGNNVQHDPLCITPVFPTDGFYINQNGRLLTYKDGVETFHPDWDEGDEGYALGFTNGEDHKLGFRIEPSEADPTKFDIHVFTDGEFAGTFFEKEMTDKTCKFIIGTAAHGNEITVKDAIVIQEKDVD